MSKENWAGLGLWELTLLWVACSSNHSVPNNREPWVWKDFNTEVVQFIEWDTRARITGQILHLSASEWGILRSQPVAEHSQLQHLGEREIQALGRSQSLVKQEPGSWSKGMQMWRKDSSSGTQTRHTGDN